MSRSDLEAGGKSDYRLLLSEPASFVSDLFFTF
jgi:hypothetical protein